MDWHQDLAPLVIHLPGILQLLVAPSFLAFSPACQPQELWVCLHALALLHFLDQPGHDLRMYYYVLYYTILIIYTILYYTILSYTIVYYTIP